MGCTLGDFRFPGAEEGPLHSWRRENWKNLQPQSAGEWTVHSYSVISMLNHANMYHHDSSCIHNAYTIAPCSHVQRSIEEKIPPLPLMVCYSVGEKDFPLGRSTRGEEERCHVICGHLTTSTPLVGQQLGIRQHGHQLQPLQPWHL